jgi:hypothetical protein
MSNVILDLCTLYISYSRIRFQSFYIVISILNADLKIDGNIDEVESWLK